MASGRLILPLSEPTLSASAVPQVGATLTVFLTGTDTLAGLFADVGLATPISNPQVSNAAGRFYDQTTVIWADASVAYDCVLQLPNGEMFSYENIYLLGAPESISGFAPINSPNFTGVPTAPTPAANDASSKIATTQFVAAALASASILPPGLYGMFAMTSIPSGWLLCDGSAVSRSTYAALFGQIGTTYGAGDGSTTFNLPPAANNGAFLRAGGGAAAALGTLQGQQLQGHLHQWGVRTSSGTGGVVTNFASGGDNTVYQNQVNSTGAAASGSTSTPLAAGDGTNGPVAVGNETRPVNLTMVLCIKT
jgi:microcystin-dependent protein